MHSSTLPLPPHYDPKRVDQIWRVDYEARAQDAAAWQAGQAISPAAGDRRVISLILVDVQNTFCLPGFELFVPGAPADNRRLTEFIYHNLGQINRILCTLDSHRPVQIFHAIFLVNEKGEHPAPMTQVDVESIENGLWRFNRNVASGIGIDPGQGQEFLLHYVRELKRKGKYSLTVWPYHAMTGGIGHALVSSVEEAVFFHSLARQTQPGILIKGDEPRTENYSAIRPEVMTDSNGNKIAQSNPQLLDWVRNSDLTLIAGQAKSHCVAWTVEDLLQDIQATDPDLVHRLALLDDCASPVIVPGVVDYSDLAEQAYQRFEQAGIRRVKAEGLKAADLLEMA
jgi:nicotinamidase-related amidase